MHDEGTHRVAIIMAGGSGERFWPLSRTTRPKQLLKLGHPEKSLLEQSIERIESLIPRRNIFISTGKHLLEAIKSALPDFPEENILCEPLKRNTAGCLSYTAACLLSRFGDPEKVLVAVLTADHLITPTDKFLDGVDAALITAEREQTLVVMGIKPTRAETGYGYIETAPDIQPVWVSSAGVRVFAAAGFREKPTYEVAVEFLKSGRFYWNSGMFFWNLRVFLNELHIASPIHTDAIEKMTACLRTQDRQKVESIFETLPDISIDYALMEKAQRVHMVEATFDWDDIGAWDALDRTYPHDEHRNICIGEPIVLESSNCIVYNESDTRDHVVAVLGMENVAVIACKDAVLVIPKNRAQDVRKIVAELRRKGFSQL